MTTRRRRAFHEAGHYVAALAHGLRPSCIALGQRPAKCLGTEVSHFTRCEAGSRRAQLRSQAIAACAGILGEVRGCRSRRTIDTAIKGAEADLLLVEALARRLHRRQHVGRALGRYFELADRTLVDWWAGVEALAREALRFGTVEPQHADLVVRAALGEGEVRGALAQLRAGRARVRRGARQLKRLTSRAA